MRILTAHRACPAFPKSRWQDRDPENGPHIERPHLPRPPRLPARQAVVVAKRHPLRHPLINSMNDEQCSPPLLRPKMPKILHLPNDSEHSAARQNSKTALLNGTV